METDTIVTSVLFFNEEQIGHEGEDSVQCLTGYPNAAIIASMDGCGGSGAQRYEKANNVSGARLASMHVASAVKNWFDEKQYGYHGSLGKSASELADEMKTTIDYELASLKAEIGHQVSGVKSRLLRTFPTTLAAVMVEVIEKNMLRCISFWAGDSRAYLFTASSLQQMSRDDNRSYEDPFEVLENDGVLSNVICADKAYEIHSKEITIDEPCMVLTATDGCFSYLLSPIAFEGILLGSLMESESPVQWEDSLKEILGEFASDDYTMEIAILGFQNWNAVKNAYAPRWQEYQEKFAEPLERILEMGDRQAHLELWQSYKTQYMPAEEWSQP